MDFDTLIGGDYKLVVEPLAYLCYNGQQFAMTATEAALYDQIVNGDLRKKLGTLTHKNLPLAIFLEEADLGYTAWSGSRTEKASNGDIISSLGIGIVRFNEVTTPPEPGEYDYEYRVNTEVITSVEVRGGQSDPDNPVSVRFNIQGRTYTVSNVYYPDGDSQLAWVRWRTPAEPCVITISVSVYGGGSAQGTITCNIVDLDGNDPPNPLADDRNNGFRLVSVPQKEQVTSASWGIWSPWWQENWEWVENWQKCWHTDRWTDADGKTHRDRWYHWVDNGWWEDHGWWEFDYNGYSASLTASMRITPDEKSPTATASTLKSGYGIQEKVTAKVTTNQSAAVTAAQNAVTYFPEFGYENYWRLLEAEISGRSTTFQFKANPYRDLAMLLYDAAAGSDSFLWNGHTTLEANSRFICLDTHDLQNASDNVKRTQYLNLLSWCWEEMSRDRNERCLLVCDEAYLMIDPQVPQSLVFLRNVEKRARKYEAGLAIISHSVVDFLAPEVKMYGQALLDIPCYKILMGCDGKNLQETKDLYNLTDAEQELLESKRRGHALFIIGSKRLHVNFEIPAYKFSYMGKAGGR